MAPVALRVLGAAGAAVLLLPAVLLPAAPAAADSDTLPGVAQVNPNYQQRGCLTASAAATDRTPWPQTFLRPEAAWALTEGDGVTVAVLGSGVDGASGALAGRLSQAGRLSGGGDPARDCVGHGTFVAGLIAAAQRPGTGFAGIAPRARILAVGVTDEAGNTSADLLVAGIRAAADGGARVIDVAAAPPSGAADALSAAARYAVGKGALVVLPAAADAQNRAQAQSPGPSGLPTGPGVLAVGDLGPTGLPPQVASSATPAAATGGRVDLVAPGDAVMSVGPGGPGYFTGSGPSFATAFVAGTAALVLAYRPELTVDQLTHRLTATAYHPGTTLPDARLGYGTVDPVAAVTAVLPQESGATPLAAPPPGAAMLPPAARSAAAPQALAVAGGALAVVVAVALAAVVLPRGRRAGWRPQAGRAYEE